MKTLKTGKSKESISKLVADLDEDGVVQAVRARLNDGEDPFHIVDQCQLGVMQVGRLYEQEIYFISGLIMAGQIMQRVSQLVLPVIQGLITANNAGRILLGTVQGDIHYVGKNLVKILMQCFGFSVLDAGEDVEPTEFLRLAKEFSPHVVGMSCLITSAYESMRETISYLRTEAQGFEYPPHILIGGNIDGQVCRYVGADHWAPDAMDGIRICQEITRRFTDSDLTAQRR